MKSFKNFLVEKENPNNPSEEKPQISKSDAKKIQRMKDADPDAAKRIQAGLESSREAARRIRSGETRTSQSGQRTRTRPSTLGPDRIGGDQPDDPSRRAQARQSGRVRTGGDPLKPDTREKPKADTAKVTPEKQAEVDKFTSSRRGRPAGQGEVQRAAAMKDAKADGADKPFKTPRSRGADLLDRLTGRTTRTRSSAKPATAFGKPSGTDPKTGKAMYVPPKDIPQRDQRVDPKTGKATQAGVRNYAMSQGGYARSGRDMPKSEFDKVKARADKISSDPTSAEYKKIEKKINQEYGGRRMRRRPSNAPSFAQVQAEIDAKEAQKTKPQKSAKAVPPKPSPTPTPAPEQSKTVKTPKKSYSDFSKFTQQNMRGASRPKAVATPEPPAQPKAPKPEFGQGVTKPKGGGAKTPGTSTVPVKNPISKSLKPTTSPTPSVPKPNPIAGFVKGALKRGRSVKPGSPLSMAAQLAAGEVLDRVGQRLQAPMGRAVTRGIASLTGTTDKMKKLKPSAYDMAGPDLTPEIVKRLKPKPVELPTNPPETKPSTETEGEYTINRRGRKVKVRTNTTTTSSDPKTEPKTEPALAPAPPVSDTTVKDQKPPKQTTKPPVVTGPAPWKKYEIIKPKQRKYLFGGPDKS